MIANLTLSKTSAQATSTWTGYNVTPSIGYTVPTWDYDSITVTVPATLAGAVFNSCTLTLNRNTASGSAYVRFSDTKEDVTAARILARLKKGDTKFTMQFGFKASGYTGGIGDHSSVARWWGTAYQQPITIAVDYLPAGKVNGTVKAGASSVFYSIKQTSLQLSETGNLTLAVTPSVKVTKITMDIRPHGQTDYISLNYSVSMAANAQTSLTKTFVPSSLTMVNRVAKADIRFTLTTSSGTQQSSWTTTQLTLVRERLAPVITAVWSDDTNVMGRFGAFVQGKSIGRVTMTITLDTEADADITTKSRTLTFDGTKYTSGNNTFTPIAMESSGTAGYTLSVTDSFGITGTDIGTVAILPYSPPRLSVLAIERYVTRQTESGATYDELDDDGVKVWTSITGAISALAGINAWHIAYSYNGTETTILSGTDGQEISYTDDKTLITREFSEQQEHSITVIVVDEFESARYTVVLPKAGAILSVEVGGVGVGKRNTATKEAPQFQCAYPAVFDSNAYFGGNIYDSSGVPITYDVYSKSEKRIGTWIDGKALYRKVIEVSSVSTDSSSPTTVSLGVTTKRIVRIDGFLKTKNYGDTPLNSYHSAAFRTFTRSDGASKLVSYAGTSFTNNGAVFIVEYTKS